MGRERECSVDRCRPVLEVRIGRISKSWVRADHAATEEYISVDEMYEHVVDRMPATDEEDTHRLASKAEGQPFGLGEDVLRGDDVRGPNS